MTASYLHGVETITIEAGPTPTQQVKTAVVGLVGTAPIQDVDADNRTVNEPVIVSSATAGAKYFGEKTAGYTIPAALDAIFDHGAGTAIVVNVFDPDTHVVDEAPDPSAVLASDIVGSIDAGGNRSGLKALEGLYNRFGYQPKIIIAPTFCTQTSVSTEMISLADKVRGVTLIDAPIGTTVQGAIEGRGTSGSINFYTSSGRAILCYPHLKVYDTATDTEVLEPFSQRLAGLMCKTDLNEGYWVSPSNHEISGIIGLETAITAAINDSTTEANQLNEAGVTTVFNAFGTGWRAWGNRTAAWPTVTHPMNFIPVRRTFDVLAESIEYSMLKYLDKPISAALIDAVCESVNAFINTLIGRGALIDGRCRWLSEKNPVTEIAAGHLTFTIEAIGGIPAERFTFEHYVDTSLLTALAEQLAA